MYFSYVAALGNLIVLSIIVVSFIWWLWYRFSNFASLLNKIPGPRSLPIFGCALDTLGGCDGEW